LESSLFSGFGILMLMVQTTALVGAVVGGAIAHKRKVELSIMNEKLRVINAQLWKQREELQEMKLAESEAKTLQKEENQILQRREALEAAMSAPSAAHPVEGFGPDRSSLAQARRDMLACFRQAKAALSEEDYDAALSHLLDAERSAIRGQAFVHRKQGDFATAVTCLERVLVISSVMRNHDHDADIFGEMADAYTEMGDFVKAGEYYDRCISCIQDD